MGNLKNALRAQWRPDFDLQEDQGNIVKKTVINLVTLVGLIVLIAVTFALASVSTALADERARLARPDRDRLAQPGAPLRPDRLLDRGRLGAVHVPVHRAARGPGALAGGPPRAR